MPGFFSGLNPFFAFWTGARSFRVDTQTDFQHDPDLATPRFGLCKTDLRSGKIHNSVTETSQAHFDLVLTDSKANEQSS